MGLPGNLPDTFRVSEEKLRAASKLSALFEAPGMSIKSFLIDWLHAVDLGVSQSVLGNLFSEVIELLEGSTRKDRVQSLWRRIKAWYAEAKPPSRLDALTPEMVKLPGKGPKLRSKAGECRYLLAFGAQLAAEFDDGSIHRNTVNLLMRNLLDVSVCISMEPYDFQRAAKACHKVCALFTALEQVAIANNDILSWRAKPTLHMFQELIQFIGPEFGSPRHFWTYLDESWGGWLSRVATRRGGPKFAASCALNMINKYRAVVTAKL